VYEARELGDEGRAVDRAVGGRLKKLLGRGDFSGRAGESLLLTDWPGLRGGRLLLVEGRWSSVGDQGYARGRALPWPGGAPEGDLREAVAPLVERVDVVPLADPRLWGGEVDDERYLLVGYARKGACGIPAADPASR